MAERDQLIRDRLSSYKKASKKKVALLSDAAKMDKYVSGISQQLSPTMKMAKKSKADLLVDRVDRSIDDKSSMKGFGPEFRQKFASELAKPENAGYSARNIAKGITKSMLLEVGEKGKTRLERAYEDYRVEESSRGFLFLGSGKRKSAKPPAALPGMKTYDEWKADRRAEEDVKLGEEYTGEGYIKSVKTATQIGAGIGASAAAIAGQLGPQVATPEEIVTVPTAAAIGGLVTGVGETLAYPFRKLIDSTEWGRARKAKGGFKNIAKLMAVKYGPDVALTAGAEVKLLKSVVLADAAKQAAIAKPTAQRVTIAKEADDSIVKTMKKPMNMRKSDGVKRVMRYVKDNNLDVPKDELVDAGKKYGTLSKEGMVEAVKDPEGLVNGIAKQHEKESALKFAEGKTTADAVVKTKVKPKAVTEVKKAKTTTKVETAKTEVVTEKAADTVVTPKPKVTDDVVDKTTKVEANVQEKEIKEVPAGKDILDLTGRNSDREKVLVASQKPVTSIVDEVTEGLVKGEKKVLEEAEHAYLPTTVKGLSEIIEGGLTGKKSASFRFTEESASIARKGGQMVRVKKDALTAEKATKKTLTSKTAIGPEDIEIKSGDRWLSPEDYKTEAKLKMQYDELGTYYDELLTKYHPELDIASTKKPMIKQVLKAAKDLPDKLSPGETNILNEMMTKYDDVERAVVKLKKEIPDISLDNMRSSMVSIMKGEKAGELAAKDAIKQVEELSLRVNKSPTMAGIDKNESMGAMAEYVARLRKQSGITSFMTAFGVGAATLMSLTADEAEAANYGGILTKSFTKEALEGFTKKTISALERKQLAVGRVMSDDVMFIPEKAFQTGLTETLDGGAKYFLNNINKVYRASGKSIRRSLMSPQMQFNEILKATEGKLINPAVFKATFFNSEALNVKNGLRVASNIFKDGNIASAKKEVIKMFDPLIPKAEQQYLHDYHKQMADELGTKLKKMKKPNKAVSNEMKHDIYKHEGVAKKLESDVADYHTSYQEIAEEAANKYSSARVFFAADDSVKFKKYPFMKNIDLSQDELLAVGRMKRQMAEYRLRLEKNKVNTISGDYMHYSLHPKVNSDMLAARTGDSTAAPWMKNFSRSANARPLIPDAVESLSKYIPDVERRIQTQAFWNSGWDKVMQRAGHIDPLRKAFEALKEGTAPFENTWTNNIARWYTNVEVFKRLFLSPSAGLKHLVKLTGDMSTLGVRTTLKSLPSSVKGVSYRIIEDTPFMKKIAGDLYNPNQYTKMKKQLLDSVAPAMDTRYRMMQMGYGNYDTYFSKLGVMADQVNHVGGVWINLAELIDRGTTMEAGLRIAAKKGMTPDQSLYGIYDTILKNNFLGREFTPQWLRNPKFKALTMFQTTPYKIMEKRAIVAIRTGRAVKGMGKDIFNATKTPEGRQQLLTDLMDIKRNIQVSEQELKSNLFLDALRSEKDFYGNSVVKQFTKDLIIMGAGTAAAGSVGLNMHHHFFHLPFMKSTDYGDAYGTLALSPAVRAIEEGRKEYHKKLTDDEDSFMLSEILQKWAGKSGPFPDTVWKYNRISQDDIPAVYQDSPYQYLFAIPSKERD